MIIPTTEPFLFPGKKDAPGVLLTHGFTGTPKEMRWMGEYLNKKHGYTCLGPRLTGHATRPEDMIRSRYTDWMSSLEDGYRLLADCAPRVYLAGLSMGGALSLLAASYLPARGVIAMAAPYNLPHDWRLKYATLLCKARPYMPKTKHPPEAGWFDQQAWKDHIAYPQNPLRSIVELKKLLDEMRAALPKVTIPLLLVYSSNDRYLPLGSLDSMNYIYTHIGATDRQKVVVERSGHVLTRDAARETVFNAAADFIDRIEMLMQ